MTAMAPPPGPSSSSPLPPTSSSSLASCGLQRLGLIRKMCGVSWETSGGLLEVILKPLWALFGPVRAPLGASVRAVLAALFPTHLLEKGTGKVRMTRTADGQRIACLLSVRWSIMARLRRTSPAGGRRRQKKEGASENGKWRCVCINPHMVPATTFTMRPHTTTQDRNTHSEYQVEGG